MFSSRSFMILGLTHKSLNPFWVDFCIQENIGVQINCFACGYLVFLAPFTEEPVLFPLYILYFIVN